MDYEKIKELLDYFEIGDDIALGRCIVALEHAEEEYFPLWCLAKSAQALNPFIVEMEQGHIPYHHDIDDAYRVLVMNIQESLKSLLGIESQTGFTYHPDTKTFHCRKCGAKVAWEHPDITGKFMFSSRAEGDEENGICYDCWSAEHYSKKEKK